MTVQTRRVPDLFTRADVVANSYNADDNTIEVCFATQTPVRSWDWDNWQPFNEVLVVTPEAMRMQRFEQGAPFLKDHRNSTDSVLGTTVSVRIEQSKAFARIRLSKNQMHDGIITDIKDGIIRNVSVGYKVYRYEKDPKSENETIPTYRAIDWEPHEVSAVGVPADANAQVRSESGERIFSTVEIIERNMPNETNPNPQTDPVTTPVTPPAPANPPLDTTAIETRAAVAERERVAEIMNIAKTANLPQTFIKQHITAGTPLDAVRSAAFAAMAAAQPPAPKPNDTRVIVDERDKQIKRMQNALLLRSNAYKGARTEEMEKGAREYQNMMLREIAADCLTHAGLNPRNMNPMEMVGRAFTSTSDFPILLEGTTQRVLLAAYQTQSDTWRQWCAVGSVSDFRKSERLRMGTFGALDTLTENAEYRRKKITDAEKEFVQIGTKGNLINISRQAIINDDLNAFTTLAARFGRAAALSIEIDAYALLNSNPIMGDGIALFHATHKNIVSGGAAPTVEQFEKMRLLLEEQMDMDGNEYLAISLANLLVPHTLRTQATLINEAQYNPDQTGKFQLPNTSRGLFNQIVSTPRLSGTAYYGFAAATDVPTIEVSFLNGVQTPYMEQQDGFTVDGTTWKIRLDYGVNAVDWRGAVKNPGA